MKNIALIQPSRRFTRSDTNDLFGSATLPYGVGVLASSLKNNFPDINTQIIDFNRLVYLNNGLPKFDKTELALLDQYLEGLRSNAQIDFHSLSSEEKRITKNLFLKYFDDIAAVGFTIMSQSALRSSYLLAMICKWYNEDIQIIFGGPFIVLAQASSPEAIAEILHTVDFLCIQPDGPAALNGIADHLFHGAPIQGTPGIIYRENGQVVTSASDDSHIESEPPASFAGLSLRQYTDSNGACWLPYRFSRGCSQNCSFCSHRSVSRLEYKSISKITAEIDQLRKEYDSNHFLFYDSAINNNPKLLEAFCDHFAGSDLKWKSYAITNHITEALLRKMKRSGCDFVSWGIESTDNTILRSINKPFDGRQALSTIKTAAKCGINQKCSFIIGWPFEKTTTIIDVARDAAAIKMKYGCIVEVCPLKLVRASPLFYNPDNFKIKLIDQIGPTLFTRENIHYEEIGGLDESAVLQRRWLHSWYFQREIVRKTQSWPLRLPRLLSLYRRIRRTFDPKYKQLSKLRKWFDELYFVALGRTKRIS
ncbi:MAG: radical SAM protein [Candidatus Alcyoniella australis]|nr:radical SAM protein [Candidatus Alcyoniella australis]